MTLKLVLLPDPFGPAMPRNSPALTSKLTSLTAVNPPNFFVTLRRERIGDVIFTGQSVNGGPKRPGDSVACTRAFEETVF